MTQQVFGMIYFPSPRAAAYIQVLAKEKCLPQHIVIMQSDRLKRASEIIQDHPLATRFFDLQFDIESFCLLNNLTYTKIETGDINSLKINTFLRHSSIRHWLFSGGGILKAPLFELGKDFWHWHPGDLPTVKGSTCFYYSLLHDLQLVVSAFRMNDQIDAGEPQKRSSFRLNIDPDHLTTAFMDVIVDPWVRALALAECLKDKQFFNQAVDKSAVVDSQASHSTIDPNDLDSHSQPLTDRPCYIIHPLLRWIAIEKVNATYDSALPESIVLI